MATCKDCLHHPVCRLPFNTSETQVEFAHVCHHFKNKADFVEVVRCKDCIHHFPPPHPEGQYSKCKHSCLHTKMTDYCSYGERKIENG